MTSASDGHHVGLTRCLDKHGLVTDAPKAKIKIDTFSKLGFVHTRSVFEPPKPKVDYLYYVFGKTSKKHPPEATLASWGPPGPK